MQMMLIFQGLILKFETIILNVMYLLMISVVVELRQKIILKI